MAAESKGCTLLIGLQVSDAAGYRRYREAMTPILGRYGGHFGYDFVIAEVLRSAVEAPINRVFTLVFADEAARQGFFADPAYLAVRAEHFEPSVEHVTKIAEYV